MTDRLPEYVTTKEVSSAMPAPSNPLWTTGPGGQGSRRHSRYGNPDLRASDAERTEVADRLSRHYQDGRLDQAEFNERLDRAMNAKTRADFSGLFADLPDLPDPADQNGHHGQAAQGTGSGSGQRGQSRQYTEPRWLTSQASTRRHRSGGSTMIQIFFIAAVVIVSVILVHALMHSLFPWLLIALLAVVLLRHEQNRRRS